MQRDERITVHRRRTRAEVVQLVAEFVDSGMRRSEFCRSRGLSLSTLDRHLRKRGWKRKKKSKVRFSFVEEIHTPISLDHHFDNTDTHSESSSRI